MIHGVQDTTDKVHRARTIRDYANRPQLVPACGGINNARIYLFETDRPLSCQRCIAKAAKLAAKAEKLDAARQAQA